jgi:hypothetical protein
MALTLSLTFQNGLTEGDANARLAFVALSARLIFCSGQDVPTWSTMKTGGGRGSIGWYLTTDAKLDA